MIKCKADLQYYIDEDRKAFGLSPLPSRWWLSLRGWRDGIRSLLFPDTKIRFLKCLRRLEYLTNCGGNKLFYYYYGWKHSRLGLRTGIELSVNCAGAGIHISHGKVVVNADARLGDHCKLLSDVTIGGQGRYDVPGAPILGKRVYVGSGAKIIGPIKIADDVVIGANSVVVKDILEPGITVAGIPARKISNTGSYHYLNRV